MKKLTIILIVVLAIFSCKTENTKENNAPVAKVIPQKLTIHGDTRIDNYHWMRLSDEQKNAEIPDAQTQDVKNYLNAENEYLKETMQHTDGMQQVLYDEMIARKKKDFSTVPISKNGYTYTFRFEEGQNYGLNCRVKNEKNAQEEIILNEPKLAKGHEYFRAKGLRISTNNNLLIYGIDTIARQEFTLYVKDLTTGKLLDDKIEKTTGSAVWANDNKTLFYTKKDPKTLRQYRIYKHVLGTNSSEDELVFEEKDAEFNCSIYKTKSNKYLIIETSQTLSSESLYLDANTPNGKWQVILPREVNHEYSVQHYNNDFYIKTNSKAKNFRLIKTPVHATAKENWTEIIPHRNDVMIRATQIFKNYLVVQERKNGLDEFRVIKWNDLSEHYIEFNDPAYSINTKNNIEFNTDTLCFSYMSLTTPYTVYKYNMKSKDKELIKQDTPNDPSFSSDNYTSERIYATARDGVKIPISLVYKKGTIVNENTPLLLNGYGSYGYNYDPYFSNNRLSLLDRGFVCAIAHIRGGQEMGRDWYENGKLLTKKNTFYDFIDCSKFLIKKKYTSSKHMYAWGGSAGGLLMGAVINMEPNLWNGVIARVPFVDVVTTMLDESIPLTTAEFDEWGNPKNKDYYDYMLSYSPYDNVVQKKYPNLLITTGFWDDAVQYWEPAKWTAKLRANKTDNNLLLLSCNMNQGHGSGSGRYGYINELALQYSFMLDLEDIRVTKE